MPQFEVNIIIHGSDGATSEHLEAAVKSLFGYAKRMPPDRRFDWAGAAIAAAADTDT